MPAAAALSSAVPIGQSLALPREKLPLSTEQFPTCNLERSASAEPLSPPAQPAQQPASPPQDSGTPASQQHSPVDERRGGDRRQSDEKADPAALVRAAAAAAVAAAAAAATAAALAATEPPPPSTQPSTTSQSSATSSASPVTAATAAARPSSVEQEERLPPPTSFQRINLKGQGLGSDDVKLANDEVRAAIEALGSLLEEQPTLEIKAAESEAELLEALKLYRDMNHLSLTGVTCDQVVEHVLSHTVLLLYRPDPDEPAICVTAATFTMRESTMMLRLLATHPRMTRKGFGRITVHFLKELCRALQKDGILVYTYPSSSPFYKALHFRHTHPEGGAKPPVAEAGADAANREASREARRAFSAKENEMIFHVQPSMAHVLAKCSLGGECAAHPYACTRRRASAGAPPPVDTSAEADEGDHPPRPMSGSTSSAASAPAAPNPRGRPRGSGKRGAASSGAGKAPAAAAPSCSADASSGQQPSKTEVWLSSVTPRFPPPDREAAANSRSKRPRHKTKDVYQVEEILDVQRSASDATDVKYLIKWKGWPSKYNTWEPLGHLQNLQQEIEAFEASRKAA